MQGNSIDELRRFFGLLKDTHDGRVKALLREQIIVEADMCCLKNTNDAAIDRIMEAIKHSL